MICVANTFVMFMPLFNTHMLHVSDSSSIWHKWHYTLYLEIHFEPFAILSTPQKSRRKLEGSKLNWPCKNFVTPSKPSKFMVIWAIKKGIIALLNQKLFQLWEVWQKLDPILWVSLAVKFKHIHYSNFIITHITQ